MPGHCNPVRPHSNAGDDDLTTASTVTAPTSNTSPQAIFMKKHKSTVDTPVTFDCTPLPLPSFDKSNQKSRKETVKAIVRSKTPENAKPSNWFKSSPLSTNKGNASKPKNQNTRQSLSISQAKVALPSNSEPCMPRTVASSCGIVQPGDRVRCKIIKTNSRHNLGIKIKEDGGKYRVQEASGYSMEDQAIPVTPGDEIVFLNGKCPNEWRTVDRMNYELQKRKLVEIVVIRSKSGALKRTKKKSKDETDANGSFLANSVVSPQAAVRKRNKKSSKAAKHVVLKDASIHQVSPTSPDRRMRLCLAKVKDRAPEILRVNTFDTSLLSFA